MDRVAEHGLTVAWAPTATVWWQMQPGLASTFHRFVTYSRHNVRAGLQRKWHYGVARQYLVAAGFLALGVLHARLWLLALPLGLIARTARNLWRRRSTNEGGWLAFNPVQFLGVLGILLALDAATFVGWMQARVRRPIGDEETA